MGVPEDLKGARYINLYTYRRNGSTVKTTVLAAVMNDEILVHTDAYSGKVKRIRARGEAMVQRSTILGKELGPLHRATAELVDDEGLKKEVARCCLEKMASYLWHDKILRKKSVIIRIRVLD